MRAMVRIPTAKTASTSVARADVAMSRLEAPVRTLRESQCEGVGTSPLFRWDLSHVSIRPLGKLAIQTKLAVNRPDDALEQEADRISEHMMRAPSRTVATPVTAVAGLRVQRQCACGGSCSTCQGNAAALEFRQLQRKAAGTECAGHTAIPLTVTEVLRSAGRPLDTATRAFIEPRLGYDFSRVRLHDDRLAAESAEATDARAYTVGHHVVFGAGEFLPHTIEGRRLLAHELVHVVQQSSASPLAEAGSVGAIGGRAPGPALQRAPAPASPIGRRGSAGGCGICLGGDSRVAGKIAHEEIQSAFKAADPAINTEVPVPVVPGDETPPFSPHLDLAKEKEHRSSERGKAIEIGEIKPLDDEGAQVGMARQQLQGYARELHFTYDEVTRMRQVPPSNMFFANPSRPAKCPPQMIQAQLTEPGIYQYWCEPPYSTLVRDPDCACGPRRRRQPQVKQVEATKSASKSESKKTTQQPAQIERGRLRVEGYRPIFEDVANRLPYMEAPVNHQYNVVIDSGIYQQTTQQAEQDHMKRTEHLMSVDPRDIPMFTVTGYLINRLGPIIVFDAVALAALLAIPVVVTAPEAGVAAGVGVGAEAGGVGTAVGVGAGVGVPASTIEVPAGIAAAVSSAAAGAPGAAAAVTGAGMTWAGGATVTQAAAAAMAVTLVAGGMSEAEASAAVKPLIGKRIYALVDTTDMTEAKGSQEITLGGQSFTPIMRLTSRKF
jgi:hypothetical protein